MIYGVIISNHTCKVKHIRPCPWFHEGGTAVVITASRLWGVAPASGSTCLCLIVAEACKLML